MGRDVKRFYLDSVLPHVQTFNNSVELMGHKYNADMQKNRAKSVLKAVRLQEKFGENQD